jgi:hypothetical protein
MAQPIQHVNPGDLITAAEFNLFIDVLNTSVARIEALEAGVQPGSGLAITQLIPGGPYRVGDTLQILGRNFQFTIGAHRVFFNSTQVLSFLPTSTDSRLEFVIPTVPGVQEQGTSVSLVVVNQTESVTNNVILRPRISNLQGTVLVAWQGVDPATPVPGQNATFRYTIQSQTNNRATWTIVPIVDVASNNAAWNAALRVLNENQVDLPSRQIVDLNPGETRTFFVRLAPVPSGTNNVTFGLSATATAEGISGPSGVHPFTVGTATQPPDTTITPTLIPDFSSGALSGSTLTVPGGQNRQVAVDVNYTVAGSYSVVRTFGTGTNGWTITTVAGTNEAPTVTASDLAATGSVTRRLRYVVAAGPGNDVTNGQVTFTITRSGQANSNSITLNLVRPPNP